MCADEPQRKKQSKHGDLVARVVAATGRSKGLVYAVLAKPGRSQVVLDAIDAIRRGEEPPSSPPPQVSPPRRTDWDTWDLSAVPEHLLEYELAKRRARAKKLARQQGGWLPLR